MKTTVEKTDTIYTAVQNSFIGSNALVHIVAATHYRVWKEELVPTLNTKIKTEGAYKLFDLTKKLHGNLPLQCAKPIDRE